MNTNDFMHFYKKYKYIIDPVKEELPPNFEPLLKAIDDGLDINIHDDGRVYEQSTLLSYICDFYGEAFETDECHYIVDIVKFFLDHGYDVHSNNERNGISVLETFDYSYLCDKYSVEAFKLLLDAGANTNMPVFDDKFDEHTSVYDIAKAHDGDNRGITEDAPDIANFYYALWQMMDYRKQGKNYHKIHHYSHAKGKTIDRVMINGYRHQKGYKGIQRDTFDSLFFDCEGEHLLLSGGMSMILDPYHGGKNTEGFQDFTEQFSQYIGHKISDILFFTEPIDGSPCDLTYSCKIVIEDGNEIVFSQDYLSGPRPNDFFIYWEKEQTMKKDTDKVNIPDFLKDKIEDGTYKREGESKDCPEHLMVGGLRPSPEYTARNYDDLSIEAPKDEYQVTIKNDGKRICEVLKRARKEIAEANGIPFETTDCPHEGPCAGTCEKCDEELKYLFEKMLEIPEEKQVWPELAMDVLMLFDERFDGDPEDDGFLEGDIDDSEEDYEQGNRNSQAKDKD